MNDDLESQLRTALRPGPPSAGFTDRVMTCLAQADLPPASALASPPAGRRRHRSRVAGWWSAGIAATLLLTVGLRQHVQEQRERESGLEARREVLEALRLTDRKLELAYRTLKDQSPGA